MTGRCSACSCAPASGATSISAATRAATAFPMSATSPTGTDPVNCDICGRPAELISEENYFFRLSAFQDRLLELYEKRPGIRAAGVPQERSQELREERAARYFRQPQASQVGHSLAGRSPAGVLRLVRRAHQLHDRHRLRAGRERQRRNSRNTGATDQASRSSST